MIRAEASSLAAPSDSTPGCTRATVAYRVVAGALLSAKAAGPASRTRTAVAAPAARTAARSASSTIRTAVLTATTAALTSQTPPTEASASTVG